ncbi:MAG: DMT family transporter, partial [Pseudomonadota bacterium]
IVTGLALLTRDGVRSVASTQLGTHLVRNTFHYAAQYAWFLAVTLIPLAQLFALEFTTPLWVAIIAPLLLREQLTIRRIGAALLGFAGVLVIVQPGAVALDQGTLLALGAAVGFAVSVVAVKHIVRRETALSVLFHMAWMQLVFGFVLLGGNIAWPPSDVWGWLLVIGVVSLTAHYSLARAYAYADAIIVAPMDFMRLPAITLVGYLVYGEQVGIALALGSAIIIAANALNVFGR